MTLARIELHELQSGFPVAFRISVISPDLYGEI